MPETPRRNLPGDKTGTRQRDQLDSIGAGQYRYRKTTSYSPEQADHDAFYVDRDLDTGESTVSPAPPTNSWGKGSYDKAGRAVQFDREPPNYGNEQLNAGPSTTGGAGKPARRGRW